jgi:hypothetical protein
MELKDCTLIASEMERLLSLLQEISAFLAEETTHVRFNDLPATILVDSGARYIAEEEYLRLLIRECIITNSP